MEAYGITGIIKHAIKTWEPAMRIFPVYQNTSFSYVCMADIGL